MINMIIIPQIMYLDQTLPQDTYYINYYFTEMSKKIVLTLTNNNKSETVVDYKVDSNGKRVFSINPYNIEK